jgi:hypothetical protein
MTDGRGMAFVFTCKDGSRPYIREQTEDAPFDTYTKREWTGKNHLERRYYWLNGIENRAGPKFMYVNYLKYEIWNVEKEKVTYSNSWITNKTISKDNACEMTKVARSRWKIENEHNYSLKHHGYKLEHNCGHGENHAAEMFCMLKLLCFLIHGLQDLADEDYKKARSNFSSRQEFFGALRHEISFHLYSSWDELFSLLAEVAPDG